MFWFSSCKKFNFGRSYLLSDSHTNAIISDHFVYPWRWRRKPWKGLIVEVALYRTSRWKWFSSILDETSKFLFKNMNLTATNTSIWTTNKSWIAISQYYSICEFRLILADIYPIPMLTTISPVSLVDSVQRTPQLVVISFGTGLVWYSFVSER